MLVDQQSGTKTAGRTRMAIATELQRVEPLARMRQPWRHAVHRAASLVRDALNGNDGLTQRVCLHGSPNEGP